MLIYIKNEYLLCNERISVILTWPDSQHVVCFFNFLINFHIAFFENVIFCVMISVEKWADVYPLNV
jgi:hypothetical protein